MMHSKIVVTTLVAVLAGATTAAPFNANDGQARSLNNALNILQRKDFFTGGAGDDLLQKRDAAAADAGPQAGLETRTTPPRAENGPVAEIRNDKGEEDNGEDEAKDGEEKGGDGGEEDAGVFTPCVMPHGCSGQGNVTAPGGMGLPHRPPPPGVQGRGKPWGAPPGVGPPGGIHHGNGTEHGGHGEHGHGEHGHGEHGHGEHGHGEHGHGEHGHGEGLQERGQPQQSGHGHHGAFPHWTNGTAPPWTNGTMPPFNPNGTYPPGTGPGPVVVSPPSE